MVKETDEASNRGSGSDGKPAGGLSGGGKRRNRSLLIISFVTSLVMLIITVTVTTTLESKELNQITVEIRNTSIITPTDTDTDTDTVLNKEFNPGTDHDGEQHHSDRNCNENSNSNYKDNQIYLKGVQAVDRDLDGITVDISYNLNVPKDWYSSFQTTSPSYNDTMIGLHGYNIWEEGEGKHAQSMLNSDKRFQENTGDNSENGNDDGNNQKPSLSSFLGFLNLSNSTYKLIGSPLDFPTMKKILQEIKPKIFLEVGVFQGMTSTWVAKYFQTHQNDGFEESYVLSMDTWLLDLRFAWNGQKSKHVSETKTSRYFTGTSKPQGGYSTMYYHFLANCIKTKTTNRIIPLPTASQNGAMTLLSHGIRPDFIYVDASHSNPDVHIDYENFYTILRPGGVIAFDDTGVEAVRAAFDALVQKYDLEAHESHKQAYVYKRKEKDA